jgi:hypothetical protein
MGNRIVSFQDKYYKYGADSDPDRRGLTIGGFKSAFLADLEATYIFDKLNMLLTRHVQFIGTYRDDEIIIFRGRRTTWWLTQWLNIFQWKVDDLLCTKDIQFTMEIWSPGEDSGPLEHTKTSVPGIGEFHTVTVNGNSYFPYLDIQLSWNKKDELNFKVHRKPNKLVKYLNSHSHHNCHHKTAVLSGVELRLALLTSLTPANANLSMSDIYPDNMKLFPLLAS